MKTRIVAGLIMVVFVLLASVVSAHVGRIIGVAGCGLTAVAVMTDAVFDWVPDVEEDLDNFRGDVMGSG